MCVVFSAVTQADKVSLGGGPLSGTQVLWSHQRHGKERGGKKAKQSYHLTSLKLCEKCGKSPPFHALITCFSPPLAIWRKPSLAYPNHDIMTPLAHVQLPAKYPALHFWVYVLFFLLTYYLFTGVIFIITYLTWKYLHTLCRKSE